MPGAVRPPTEPRRDSTASFLAAAMIEVAAGHGYAGASVARVLAEAGVTRQAFYRHFPSREDCFLAAYRRAAAAIGARVSDAVRASPPPRRPRAAIGALLGAVAEEPAAARLFLLEALAASPAVRAEHERFLAGVERSIERFQATAAPTPRAPAAALLGGVCGVISARLLAGEPGDVEDALTGLAAWVRSYESADAPGSCSFARDSGAKEQLAPEPAPEPAPARAGRRLRIAEVQLLPRGRSALPAEAANGARRSRILAATIRQTAAKGYASLTVADVVADARVPRAAFYSQFAGKREAYLAAQTLGLRESVAAAAAEFATGESWPERVWLGLAALLDYLAAHPDLARLCLVEVNAAGRDAVVRMQENRAAYGIFLADGYRERARPTPSPLHSAAVIAALEAILRRYVVAGRAERMREALPVCAYVALAPFIGPEAALGWVEAKVPAAG